MKYSIVYAIKQIETKYPGKKLRYIEYEDGSGTVPIICGRWGVTPPQFN